ncbi:N,N-dimethylformamidase beta subunit family domain-containing protein [Micromonospora sp. GCM10011542]|uniref:N,N-dimethylformamidase beta subunit family domain-containing protein n=1 Tax=Micromonospora sp. GCM10011542 TaxID=3317337 RepID=UPI00361D2583
MTRENSRAGTRGFSIANQRFGDDKQAQIAGYASATSVAPGEDLDFHVSVAPAQEYRIQVYRLGHYDGMGARLITASPWLPGRTQQAPSVDPETGMVRCDWAPGWRLRVDRSWVSGYHLALLTSAEGWCRWVPFLVREPEPAAAGLVIVPTSTYQAYNMWPEDGSTGANLYYGFDPSRQKIPTLRSAAVSHDRPYGNTGLPALADRDIGFAQWIERIGADVSYATSEDLDRGRVDPARYRAVIFCGHDEYWTVEMRRRVAAARDSGTSLVFLSANNCYWRIRYGAADGQPDERTVACSKTMKFSDGRVPLMTQWRRAGSPEQSLIGAQYVSVVDGYADLVVQDSKHWFWAGTGLRDGDTIPRVVWGEADQVMPGVTVPSPREHTVLARSPYRRKGKTQNSDTTLYQAPSGAWVFAAGTMGWTAALQAEGFADERLQQATRNLLDRVLASPGDRHGRPAVAAARVEDGARSLLR